MARGRKLALVAAVTAIGGAAGAQPAQKVTGPVADYWVSAQTQTGFGMGAGGPSASSIMGAMGGRGSNAQHLLTLQLGSTRKATGEPAADHLPPPVLRAGESLPLLTPRAQPSQPVEAAPTTPPQFQQPKGRMLIFWGCGEHAKPGQPLVIDFAQMQPGRMPPGMEAMTKGLSVTPMRPPSPDRYATYGEWPNERTRTQVPGDGSLVGDHTVRGNYSPEIRFALGQAQDFLAPLNLTTNAKTPAGSVQLGWNPVPGAQAFLATAMGSAENDTMVLWTSSEVQASAFLMPDYISPSDIARLVGQRALMGPGATQCQVPKEAADLVAGRAMVQLVAYGGEANFVYPPRPQDPKVAWNKEWQVKVRYRSATGGMLGMAMPGMAGMEADEGPGSAPGQPAQNRPPPSKKDKARSVLRGLGGLVPIPVP
jgi:hypothetical protein